MSDWSELKRLAEAAIRDRVEYICTGRTDEPVPMIVDPAAILALIAELDKLNERCQRLAARCNSLQAALNEALESR